LKLQFVTPPPHTFPVKEERRIYSSMVLIKCWQLAKNTGYMYFEVFESSTLGKKRVKSGSESLKLTTAFKAAYFYILAGILLKNIIRTLSVY